MHFQPGADSGLEVSINDSGSTTNGMQRREEIRKEREGGDLGRATTRRIVSVRSSVANT